MAWLADTRMRRSAQERRQSCSHSGGRITRNSYKARIQLPGLVTQALNDKGRHHLKGRADLPHPHREKRRFPELDSGDPVLGSLAGLATDKYSYGKLAQANEFRFSFLFTRPLNLES